MTLSDQGVEQEFFASSEGTTVGRDAAISESTYHIDMDKDHSQTFFGQQTDTATTTASLYSEN